MSPHILYSLSKKQFVDFLNLLQNFSENKENLAITEDNLWTYIANQETQKTFKEEYAVYPFSLVVEPGFKTWITELTSGIILSAQEVNNSIYSIKCNTFYEVRLPVHGLDSEVYEFMQKHGINSVAKEYGAYWEANKKLALSKHNQMKL